eukprot:4700195-Amphidinium_carterae.2
MQSCWSSQGRRWSWATPPPNFCWKTWRTSKKRTERMPRKTRRQSRTVHPAGEEDKRRRSRRGHGHPRQTPGRGGGRTRSSGREEGRQTAGSYCARRRPPCQLEQRPAESGPVGFPQHGQACGRTNQGSASQGQAQSSTAELRTVRQGQAGRKPPVLGVGPLTNQLSLGASRHSRCGGKPSRAFPTHKHEEEQPLVAAWPPLGSGQPSHCERRKKNLWVCS